MLLNEINSNLVQKYGKERVNAILNRNISYLTHHINKICEFVYDEGIDIDKVQKAFRQYEQLKNQGEAFDYRNLNFEDFLSMLNNYSIDSVSLPNVVYTSKDKMIQIGKFQTFEEAIDFQNKTNITCCFCDKEKAWIMYNNNYSLFVIRNLYQSQKSRLRYVIVTVKDGIPYFFDMDDKSLKKERGEQVYQQYIQSLGGAESILFENKTIYNKNTNMNKKLIRLTESDLHRIVKEAVNTILNESFKSSKLTILAKQHGGIYNPINGEYYTKYISRLSDDEIGDVLSPDEMNSSHKLLGQRATIRKGLHKTINGDFCLRFNDGYGVSLKPRTETEYLFNNWTDDDELKRRMNAHYEDGSKYYQWSNLERALKFDSKKRGIK